MPQPLQPALLQLDLIELATHLTHVILEALACAIINHPRQDLELMDPKKIVLR